jgi:hypothetical protein
MSITQITEREQQLTHYLAEMTKALELMRQERDELQADAARYRWLFGARTAEECASETAICSFDPLPQDLVISEVSGFYCHKELVDQMVDAAMKGKS